MALNAEQVRVGITGELYRGPLLTETPAAPPDDSTSSLSSDWVGLGYVSDDGVEENWDDSVDSIQAWQNATTVRFIVTASEGTLGLTLIQTNVDVLETFYRGSEVVADGTEHRIDVKPVTAQPRQWVLDVIDGEIHKRYYVGNGEITERGTITNANGEVIGYPITIGMAPDANGNLVQIWSDDDAWTPPGP